ncbi:hypothetical protein IAD21_00535 [Abditibacteriota bacterium]|nr:hypothetical protein IAD21_00535 [Abditibacteriota bacterium]
MRGQAFVSRPIEIIPGDHLFNIAAYNGAQTAQTVKKFSHLTFE